MGRASFLLVAGVAVLLLAFMLTREEETDARPAQQAPPPSPVTAVRDPVRPPPPVPTPPAPGVELESAIAGQVKVARLGRPPRVIPFNCPQHAPILSEDRVVDPDLNLRWAFVYVKEGAPASKEPPKAPVLLETRGCRYDPHVLGVQVGQPLIVRNSDTHSHFAHPIPDEEQGFRPVTPPFPDEMRFEFKKREVAFFVKCDIHPWEGAWVGVVEHPYFAVTDDAGRFRIAGLPPGRYTVEVWHEKYEPERIELDLPLGRTAAWNVVMDEPK